MKWKTALTAAIICALPLLSLTGCTPKVGGSDYTSTSAQQVYAVEFGYVHSARTVLINDSNTNTAIGAVGGGVIGGIIGNMFGRGHGNTLATMGGAMLGAAMGGAAGQGVGNQQGVEVTVTLDSGKTIVVVQGADMQFYTGQRVRVTTGAGSTRVSPE